MHSHRRLPSTDTTLVSRRSRFRLSTLAAALASAGVFAVAPVRAVPISEGVVGDFGDSLAVATPGSEGDQFFGSVSESDPNDFVRFAGLVSGATYSLTLNAFCCYSGSTLFVDGFLNGSPTSGLSAQLNVAGQVLFENLTGLTALDVGLQTNSGLCCEGYNVLLERTADPSSVSEPASVALLAAGLAGAVVARRRRRG